MDDAVNGAEPRTVKYSKQTSMAFDTPFATPAGTHDSGRRQAPTTRTANGAKDDAVRSDTGHAEAPHVASDNEQASPVPHKPMLLTVRDVEAELQLGRTRTYELVRSGAIPVLRVGRAVRIPHDALRRWIDDQCATPKAHP